MFPKFSSLFNPISPEYRPPRVNMASRFGSFGSNDSHLDSPVADWHPVSISSIPGDPLPPG